MKRNANRKHNVYIQECFPILITTSNKSGVAKLITRSGKHHTAEYKKRREKAVAYAVLFFDAL